MPTSHALSNGPSKEVEANWMRQVRTQKRKCEEENGVYRSLIKRAKADGMNTRAMLTAIAKTKLEPDVVAQDLAAEVRYMSILHINTVTPDAIFADYEAANEDIRSETDMEWTAGEEGYRAGRSNIGIDDGPYQNGTPYDAIWRQNWHQGQASLAREMGDNVSMAPVSRGRPKRASGTEPLRPETSREKRVKATKPNGRRATGPSAALN